MKQKNPQSTPSSWATPNKDQNPNTPGISPSWAPKAITTPDNQTLGPVRAWSYSTLKKFEECPYRLYLSKVERVPEDYGPAAQRGIEIHTEAEHFVDGTVDKLSKNLENFEPLFKQLRELCDQGTVSNEGDWAFTIDWDPTGWFDHNVWCRIKLDSYVQEDKTSARAIDYKTGRKFGNEIPHSQQMVQYAIGSFLKFPELEFIQTELWYLDHKSAAKGGNTLIRQYTREQAMVFLPKIQERAMVMTTCKEFKPKPSTQACRWCSYRKTGACEFGVD